MEPPEFEDYVCTYVCGECDYAMEGWWSQHQGHYKAHRLREILKPSPNIAAL